MGFFKLYNNEPLLGLDVGHASFKLVEVAKGQEGRWKINGYGSAQFSRDATSAGIISKPETIVQAYNEMLANGLVGHITSRKVACSLPTVYTFSRPMRIPKVAKTDIDEAVRLEAEQYISLPVDSLYIDYEIVSQDDKNIELSMVAVPKSIADSYLNLFEMLKLEPVSLEPAIGAVSRLMSASERNSPRPVLLLDIGSVSTDIALIDQMLIATITLPSGGDSMVNLISHALSIDPPQALEAMRQYGVADSSQMQLPKILEPTLDSLVKEIEKMARYWHERTAPVSRQIQEIIALGGGATMPGLVDYLAVRTKLPAKVFNPWASFDFGSLPQPNPIDKSTLLAAAGEAILDVREAVK